MTTNQTRAAISNVTAVLIVVAILLVGIAVSLTILDLGNKGTSPTSTMSSSLQTNAASSSSTSAANSFNSTNTFSASSSSSNTLSSTTQNSASTTPTMVYIATNNSADIYQKANGFAPSIYSALDTNTGRLGWLFETSQNDSLYTVSNNQLSLIENNLRAYPLSMTFDNSNNLAYFTDFVGGGTRLYAISQDKVVNTPMSSNLQSSPGSISYDPHYNYLYVSVSPVAMSSQTQTGIDVFNPDNGTLMSYIPTNFGQILYSYDSSNGEMFAAVSDSAGQSPATTTTIYALRGTSVAYSFNLTNVAVDNMVYDPGDGYLYLANDVGNYGISVVNPSSQSIVGNINSSSSLTSMLFDSQNGYVYVFFLSGSTPVGGMSAISGTQVIYEVPTLHPVTSALYDAQYDSILAFY